MARSTVGVSVSPVDPNRVYAIIEAEEGGVFRSDDGGRTWERTNDERKLRQRAFYYTRIYADPMEKDRVYVLNVGFWRSTDHCEWEVEVLGARIQFNCRSADVGFTPATAWVRNQIDLTYDHELEAVPMVFLFAWYAAYPSTMILTKDGTLVQP